MIRREKERESKAQCYHRMIITYMTKNILNGEAMPF